MFFDRAELFVRSGAGGVGAVSMNGQRPVGGNGGAGGDVVLLCDGSLNTLGHLRGHGLASAFGAWEDFAGARRLLAVG